MRIDADTTMWCVVDPRPESTLADICSETTLGGLRLQFLGGLDMECHPTLHGDQDAAVEDGKNRLLVWKVAGQIRADRGLALDEVVRVTLLGEDGAVIFQGDVQ